MIKVSKSQQLTLQLLKELHEKWKPHDGQLKALKPIINGDVDTVFMQNGRKWGKTEIAIYYLWRHALLNPGSACYYVVPEKTGGKDIVWRTNRLQTFGPSKYVSKILDQEMRVMLTNGSFIVVWGSENYGVSNGLTPAVVVYDEFKQFHNKFHDVMNPNRLVLNAPLLIIGTPPAIDDKNRDQYVQYADECKKDPNASWMRMDSYTNPYNDVNWLNKEKAKLFARGEQDVWYREYEGKIIYGGKASIFPMFDRDKHVFKHKEVVGEIARDLKRLDWYMGIDPGSTTAFAGLLIGIHPLNRKIYILDEVYETDRIQTSTKTIYPRLKQIFENIHHKGDFEEDVFKIFDEAAAWFYTEALVEFDAVLTSTSKHLNKKDHGLSLMKDILLAEHIMISDRCENFIKEVEQYSTDQHGNIPKKNDHLIDCCRYVLGGANYSMVEVLEIIKVDNRRFVTPMMDLAESMLEGDWTNFANDFDNSDDFNF